LPGGSCQSGLSSADRPERRVSLPRQPQARALFALEELGFDTPRSKETRLDTEAIRARLAQGAQPTDSVLTLLERGGLVEKTVRPSVVAGQKKQAAAREAAAKQAAKEAAEAKAAAEAEAKAAAEAAAAADAPAEDAAEA